jgi:hypothetical protein
VRAWRVRLQALGPLGVYAALSPPSMRVDVR